MAPRAAAKNSRPRLRDETADQTLRRLLAAQLAVVRAREPAARRGSVAALHDVRVALRRMRSLTTTFAKLEPKFLADLDARLSKTCDRMGDARDLDVWIELFRGLVAAGGAGSLSLRDRRRILAALRRRRTELAAAALACDMLPVCTGSDTGGSLRIPAAKCGVVGFRPSPGVVPSSRKLLGWTPISVVGPMGRTMAEACLQLAASAGLSAGDPLTYPLDPHSFLHLEPADLGGLRVGYTEDFGACAVDDGIRAVFRAKIGAMRHLFRSCEEIRLDLGDVHRCFDVLRAESFVAGMREAYERDPASLGPNTRANYEMGAAMSLLDSAWAQAEQTRILARFQEAFANFDVILAPTTPVSPFPWTALYASHINGEPQANYYRWLALTYVTTLTTHPALSVPCGRDTAGMPFGLQVVGRFRDDHRLLSIGLGLEQAFAGIDGLQRPRPDLARLGPVQPALTSIVTHAPDPDDARGVPRQGARGAAAQASAV